MEAPVSVVTGASGGIGKYIALGLAQAGHHVVLVGRDAARVTAAQSWIAQQVPDAGTEAAIADLSLLGETRALTQDLRARHPAIAVLVNNAGIFSARQVNTAEGFDQVLATNHLSPFVFTQALLPALGPGSRIVNVGSSTSDRARIDPAHLVLGRRWTMQRAYGQSKLALMMMTFALARRLAGRGITANVVHPGLVASGLVRTGGIIGLAWRIMAPFALSEQEGADTPLHAALAPQMAATSGIYLKNRQPVTPNPQARDPALVEQVWAATLELAAPFLA